MAEKTDKELKIVWVTEADTKSDASIIADSTTTDNTDAFYIVPPRMTTEGEYETYGYIMRNGVKVVEGIAVDAMQKMVETLVDYTDTQIAALLNQYVKPLIEEVDTKYTKPSTGIPTGDIAKGAITADKIADGVIPDTSKFALVTDLNWLEQDVQDKDQLIWGELGLYLKNATQQITTQADFDAFIEPNKVKYATFRGGSNYGNWDTSGVRSGDGLVMSIGWVSSGYGVQIVYDDESNYCVMRSMNGGSWSEWSKFAFGDYLPLEGGTMEGVIRSDYGMTASDGTSKTIVVQQKSYTDLGSSSDTAAFLREWIKWVCDTYPNNTYTTFIGLCMPNSSAMVRYFVYNTSDRDSTTGMPRYSAGEIFSLGDVHNFRTYNFEFFFNDANFRGNFYGDLIGDVNGNAKSATSATNAVYASVATIANSLSADAISTFPTASFANRAPWMMQALVPWGASNKLIFTPKENIKIEHSTDNGSTWIDSSLEYPYRHELTYNDVVKTSIPLSKSSSAPTTNDKIRITISSDGRYCQSQALWILIGNGGNGTACDVETSSDNATFTYVQQNIGIEGNSGVNIIPLSMLFGGSVASFRITISLTSIYNSSWGGAIYAIGMISNQIWNDTTGGAMSTNYPFAYDGNKSLIPLQDATQDLGSTAKGWGNVYGNKFVTDGGTSAQFVRGDGTLGSLSDMNNTQEVVSISPSGIKIISIEPSKVYDINCYNADRLEFNLLNASEGIVREYTIMLFDVTENKPLFNIIANEASGNIGEIFFEAGKELQPDSQGNYYFSGDCHILLKIKSFDGGRTYFITWEKYYN